MKILLVAVNAKYIHSNLAVFSLRAFADKYSENIKIKELTINHSEEEILKEIYEEKADVVAFSCYIWNIEIIKRVTKELKKVQRNVKVWYGGPEVSYDTKECLQDNRCLDGIMIGEGEQTFLELAGYYVEDSHLLDEIKGIAYKNSAKKEIGVCPQSNGQAICDDILSENSRIWITPQREPISLDLIPFPYENMEYFKNKIIYYESSRGCPFSCSYCLSSIDKKVRLRSTKLVMKELKYFLDFMVPQVKFVDRTFNCNKKHAMDIWRFIKENDNGVTNFHFEISADLLSEEEIAFLSDLRPGQIQFEIGVQSTNKETIRIINRNMDLDRLSHNVAAIRKGKNIHQHLDLIAGLPFENYKSFEQSFNDVYHLRPDQLQLGFLKVLKGSFMATQSKPYGIVYRSTAPYEVLYTNDISYDEILKIKGICEMIEVYYNSAQFTYTLSLLEHFFDSPMQLYDKLSDYYKKHSLDKIAHSRIKRYELLLEFFKEEVVHEIKTEDKQDYIVLFRELLILDLFLREDVKARPQFATASPLQSRLREVYARYQTDRKLIHIEQFTFDVLSSSKTGRLIKKNITLLFDYSKRDPLSKAAKITEIII